MSDQQKPQEQKPGTPHFPLPFHIPLTSVGVMEGVGETVGNTLSGVTSTVGGTVGGLGKGMSTQLFKSLLLSDRH